MVEQMKVELIDSMGSDLSVVNAARVSFHKQSDWDMEPVCCGRPHGTECCGSPVAEERLHPSDYRLINYLARHGHWTPFGHAFMSFRIKAPIFVARQLGKHQVGLCWNEVSRRYVDDSPEFFYPKTWRKRAENVKQGSSSEPVTALKHDEGQEDLWGPFDNKFAPDLHVASFVDSMKGLYTWLLESGVCPEQARMVLPQNMMTEWVWSGSLAAFARVAKLRLDPHTQEETRLVAIQIDKEATRLFPASWPALMEN